MIEKEALSASLLALLDGCTHAAAIMPWGKLGPIRLPQGNEARAALVEAHIRGQSATVTYCPAGKVPRVVELRTVVLHAYCPAADGLCRWIGIDLDAADGHGVSGLVDPLRAVACIAERCDAAGLLSGLIVSRSGGGKGRHVWLVPPVPVKLEDAVDLVAGIAVRGLSIADRDASESEVPHAFLCGNGKTAALGKSGCVELLPHSTERPTLGWSLLLPSPGAWAARGGGIIVDPFTSPSISAEPPTVPTCDAQAWHRCLKEIRSKLSIHLPRQSPDVKRPGRCYASDPRSRLHPRTQTFLEGRCPVGERDTSLYVAVCNLIGVGFGIEEAKHLALQGALACGLSQGQAQATIRSALRKKGCVS